MRPAVLSALSLCLLWLSSFPYIVQGTWAVNGTAGYYEGVARLLNSLPHVTFALDVLPQNVQFIIQESYFQTVATAAAPLIFLAILNFLAGVVVLLCFGCYRYLGCFRCRRRFRRVRKSLLRSRTDAPCVLVKWLRISFALSILAFCGIGIYGVVTLHDAAPAVAASLDVTATTLMDRGNKTYTDLEKIESILPVQYKTPLSTLFKLAEKYQKLVRQVTETFKRTEFVEYVASLVFFSVIMIFPILHIFACHFPCSRFLLSISFLVWFGVCIVWLVCGVFFSGSMALADLCMTNDTEILGQYFSPQSLESFVLEHYMVCNDTKFDKEIKKIESWFTQQASNKLKQAFWSRNHTVIDYWTQILNHTTILNADLEELKNCNETSETLTFAREKVCLDSMFGTVVITASLFAIGLLGVGVWLLGLLEGKFERIRIERILLGWADEEEDEDENDNKLPLLELNPSVPDLLEC